MATLSSEQLEVLERYGWFRDLPAGLKSEIVRLSTIHDYRAGSLIYAADDPPRGCFAVLKGEIRLLHYSASGKYAFYAIQQPSEWFGCLSELDGLPRFSDALAGLDTTVMQLGHSTLQHLLKANEEARDAFVKLICRNLRTTLELLTEKQAFSPRVHVARILVSIYGSETRNAAEFSDKRLTQEMLAAMAGLSRQTVSKVLHQFQSEGIIQLTYGKVVPHDLEALDRASRE